MNALEHQPSESRQSGSRERWETCFHNAGPYPLRSKGACCSSKPRLADYNCSTGKSPVPSRDSYKTMIKWKPAKTFYTSSRSRSPLCRCGKVSFDKKGAQTERNSLICKGRARDFGIYQCRRSNAWHLTKDVQKVPTRDGDHVS